MRLYLCWLIFATRGLQVPLLSGSCPTAERLSPVCTRGYRKKTFTRLGPWTGVKEMLGAAAHRALPVPHTVVKCVFRDAGTLVYIPQSAGPLHLSELRYDHLDAGYDLSGVW